MTNFRKYYLYLTMATSLDQNYHQVTYLAQTGYLNIKIKYCKLKQRNTPNTTDKINKSNY